MIIEWIDTLWDVKRTPENKDIKQIIKGMIKLGTNYGGGSGMVGVGTILSKQLNSQVYSAFWKLDTGEQLLSIKVPLSRNMLILLCVLLMWYLHVYPYVRCNPCLQMVSCDIYIVIFQ